MPNINVTFQLTDDQAKAIVQAITINLPTEEPGPPPSFVVPSSIEDTVTPPSVFDEKDNFGVPWHPEHHSSVKTVTVKGRFKRVRGGDKIACDRYEAGYGNAVDAEPSIPVPTVVENLPTPTPIPENLPTPEPTPVSQPITYDALLQAFKDLSERIGGEEALKQMGEIYVEVGVIKPADLNTDESLRAAVYERLVEL